MEFETFSQKLNDSPWMGSICEVGVGVPFQYRYLNLAGASKTILFAHSPYNQKFQVKSSGRSVSSQATCEMAWNDFSKISQTPGAPEKFLFSLAMSSSHKLQNEDGDSHGWVAVICQENKDAKIQEYAFHWKAIKGYRVGDLDLTLSRQATGIYLTKYISWFLRKVLLKEWETWKEAIENIPEEIKDIIGIDVIEAPNISMEEHLLLVRKDYPALYWNGKFKRPTDFIRNYSRCYRGSFNPPTLAHEEIGYGAMFEVSIDNARKGKMTLTDLAHRIKMINLLNRPVLITAEVPLFVDLHKMLLRLGTNSMEYLIGVDTFNSIVDEKYIRTEDPNFFEDFNRDNLEQSGKFLVIPRDNISNVQNRYADEIAWAWITNTQYTNVSSTEVRKGNLDFVNNEIKSYIIWHKLYQE